MEKKTLVSMIMIALFMALYCSILSYAETIVLKSGETIEGEIIERTDEFIKVDIYGIPITYYLDEIESIDGEKMGLSSKKEQLSGEAALELVCSEEAKPYALQASRYMQEDHFDKAIESFREALKLDSKCMLAYMGLGGCYTSLGKHDKAIEIFKEAIKMIPTYASKFHSLIAMEYINLGKYEEAIKTCKISLEQSPDFEEAYINLGIAYAKIGDYERAKENLKKGIDISIKKGYSETAQIAEGFLEMIP